MKYLRLLILLYSFNLSAQQNNFKIIRDTSYTLYSAAEKMLKVFPNAKLVLPESSKNFKEEKNLVYAIIGNRELHLDLIYPYKINSKKNPAVVLIHGGGWRSGDRSFVIPMAQKFASDGFAAIAVEYRLSVEAHYPAALFDIKSAIRWVRANSSKYNIDTNKIAIYGCSAGGHLAALAGTTNHDVRFEGREGNIQHSSDVHAIIDVDGVVDFFGKGTEELYKKSGEPSAAHLWLGASPDENPDIWKEAGPINHVGKNTPPVLFVNSGQERFHAGRDEMIAKLKKYNIYNEAKTLSGTIHTFWLFHPWFDETFNTAKNFLNRIFK